MRLATKTILSVILLFPVTCAASAQETTSATATTSTSSTATTTAAAVTATTTATAAETAEDSTEEISTRDRVREELNSILRQNAPELGTILALDPTLLSNEAYLAPYPDLARFLAAHPQIRHSPDFYLSRYAQDRRSELDAFIEPVSILFMTILFASALSWLVRTLIEQRRWNRLSRTQSEVHNKILDRFGTTSELLEYIKTPAGTKFLESAPIPLRAEEASPSAPVARMLWSVQIGVIVAAAAIGLLIVSARYSDESGRALFAMGMIALCIGGGFVASAAVSGILSRRLGVWQPPQSGSAE
jgi:hypothetical protein